MPAKYLIITILFLLFWLLQTSFLPHFNLLGTVPDLIFVLFFLLVFFEEKNKFGQLFFISIVAGILLDIFNLTFFGFSFILLFLIGFCVKRALFLLKEGRDLRPLRYFVPVFLVGLIIYSLAFNIYFAIFKINSQAQVLNFGIGVRVLYNLVLAMALYFIFKNLFKIHENGRQLSLFTS